MIQSKYINDLLDLLLDGDDGILARNQLPFLTENGFEYTGSGVFIRFSNESDINSHNVDSENLVLNGVLIETKEYPIEADATLFFTDGKIDYLEIWCHFGDYPEKDLTQYTLTQIWEDSPGKKIFRE